MSARPPRIIVRTASPSTKALVGIASASSRPTVVLPAAEVPVSRMSGWSATNVHSSVATMTLVLLHAFPLDSRMWDGVREPFAKRLRLVTPALGDGPPSLDDAADAVLAGLGGEPFVLGGCSMGGYLAMAILRKAPAQVAGL